MVIFFVNITIFVCSRTVYSISNNAFKELLLTNKLTNSGKFKITGFDYSWKKTRQILVLISFWKRAVSGQYRAPWREATIVILWFITFKNKNK